MRERLLEPLADPGLQLVRLLRERPVTPNTLRPGGTARPWSPGKPRGPRCPSFSIRGECLAAGEFPAEAA